VSIKPVTPLRVGRMKQDTAAKDFHVFHPASIPAFDRRA
jgi:hypothetical protein